MDRQVAPDGINPPCLTGGENPSRGALPQAQGYPDELSSEDFRTGETRAVIVDWVSAVFPLSAVGPIEPFIKAVRTLFDGTITQFRSRPGGLHGYACSVASDCAGVLIAWGGERTNDTVFLQIPGDACARVACWPTLHAFIEANRGHLTRCDLAYDCIDGEHDLAQAVSLYTAGAFSKAKGRPASCSQAGNWLAPDGKGRTLYIGKKANGKQLCVYEKGKQLGDAGSPWVRWECRLSNVDRVLPLAMLVDPASFFRGSYPCLDFVNAESSRIPTRKAQERITVAHLSHYAREAYGPLVDVLARSGATAAQVVEKLRRDAMPKRLSAPTAEELMDRANALVMELVNEELEAMR